MVIVRFRESKNPTPSKTTHNLMLEVAWTVVPVLILVVIAVPSFRLLYYTDKAPKLTKAGYETKPPLAKLITMSETELATVKNFTVFRPNYGAVQWEGAIDVLGVDLDKSVVIEAKDVSVYNEEENVRPLLKQVTAAMEGYDYEIIYVDDGSTDGTLAALKASQVEALKTVEE